MMELTRSSGIVHQVNVAGGRRTEVEVDQRRVSRRPSARRPWKRVLCSQKPTPARWRSMIGDIAFDAETLSGARRPFCRWLRRFSGDFSGFDWEEFEESRTWRSGRVGNSRR